MPDGRRVKDGVKKGKGLVSTNWRLRNSHRDVKYSIGNVRHNVITVRGVRWVLVFQDDDFLSYLNV